MRFGLLIIILSILLPNYSWGCTCIGLDSADIADLYESADYILIGHAVENIDSREYFKQLLDERKKGSEVRFVVDSILKGDLSSKSVIINQFESGNCSQIFEFGESYIVIGFAIEEFISNDNQQIQPNNLSNVQPPKPGPTQLIDKKFYVEGFEDETIDYWNGVLSNDIVVTTSMCISFYINSQTGQEVSNYGAQQTLSSHGG